MSANNWTICPKCLANEQQGRRAAQEQAKAAYGKVSEEEYRRLVQKAEASVRSDRETPSDTLREDYEIHTSAGGAFTVDYRCSCETCGFSFSFKQTVNALNPPAPRFKQ